MEDHGLDLVNAKRTDICESKTKTGLWYNTYRPVFSLLPRTYKAQTSNMAILGMQR